MFSRNFSRALIFALALAPAALLADRRVVVRPARTRVVVSAPVVFLPVVTFAAVAVAAPAPGRLAWQDTELIHRDEDWVEANFGVNERGRELALQVSARTEVDFAEVTFQNGQVQVVDFNNRILPPGLYRLADFADGRQVATVRIIARAKASQTKLSVYMAK